MNLIKLNIDVVLNSLDLETFETMVNQWPGADIIHDFYDRVPCNCVDPHCTRRAMQFRLKAMFGKDKERCARFFDLLREEFQMPLTEEHFTMACLKFKVHVTQKTIDQAWWEVYGGGSLEYMIPKGHA